MTGRAWFMLAALAFAQPASAQDFYAGKTLRIIVGVDAGGTVDTMARLFLPHLRRHIPGNPSLVVQNMPSAAGVGATNFVYEKAEPDGLTVLFNSWDPLAQVLGEGVLVLTEGDEVVVGQPDAAGEPRAMARDDGDLRICIRDEGVDPAVPGHPGERLDVRVVVDVRGEVALLEVGASKDEPVPVGSYQCERRVAGAKAVDEARRGTSASVGDEQASVDDSLLPRGPRPARAVPDGILSPLVWPARVGPGRLLARTHLEGWRGEIDAGNDGDLGTPCCKRETLKRACCRVERPPGTSGDRPRLQP